MREAHEHFFDFAGTGLSVLETSHRSEAFMDMVARTERDLRSLLGLSEDYVVLFLQGGASLQFLMAALNLARPGQATAYVDTGHWSRKAIKFAREVRPVTVLASAGDNDYTAVPEQSHWATVPEDVAYLHYTPNETIDGLEFDFIPEVEEVPLVADLSSTILSQPLPVERFDLIYAGAQKNLGPAGLTLVILRRELQERIQHDVPSQLDYRAHVAADSLFNTPPTLTWWMIGLQLAWVREEGGLEEMARRARKRADMVYGVIDNSQGFYSNIVEPRSRSRTNIPFRTSSAELDARFLAEAEAAGLYQLKGHRSRGGLRASLYNAMPMAGVEALAEFMNDFARRNG
jgi:phosphoserine aminotransferase